MGQLWDPAFLAQAVKNIQEIISTLHASPVGLQVSRVAGCDAAALAADSMLEQSCAFLLVAWADVAARRASAGAPSPSSCSQVRPLSMGSTAALHVAWNASCPVSGLHGRTARLTTLTSCVHC